MVGGLERVEGGRKRVEKFEIEMMIEGGRNMVLICV